MIAFFFLGGGHFLFHFLLFSPNEFHGRMSPGNVAPRSEVLPCSWQLSLYSGLEVVFLPRSGMVGNKKLRETNNKKKQVLLKNRPKMKPDRFPKHPFSGKLLVSCSHIFS